MNREEKLIRDISMVVRRKWDHNRYAAWLDERSPNYGDADFFVRLVLNHLNLTPNAVEGLLNGSMTVVPIKPTSVMVGKGLDYADINWREAAQDEALCDDEVIRIYTAMIKAAKEFANGS